MEEAQFAAERPPHRGLRGAERSACGRGSLCTEPCWPALDDAPIGDGARATPRRAGVGRQPCWRSADGPLGPGAAPGDEHRAQPARFTNAAAVHRRRRRRQRPRRRQCLPQPAAQPPARERARTHPQRRRHHELRVPLVRGGRRGRQGHDPAGVGGARRRRAADLVRVRRGGAGHLRPRPPLALRVRAALQARRRARAAGRRRRDLLRVRLRRQPPQEPGAAAGDAILAQFWRNSGAILRNSL